jgi:hypothetical protein
MQQYQKLYSLAWKEQQLYRIYMNLVMAEYAETCREVANFKRI